MSAFRNAISVLLVLGIVAQSPHSAWARGGPKRPPGSFTLSAPAGGSASVSLTPTLSWTPSSRAMSYVVSIGSHSASVSTTSYTVPSGVLMSGTAYSWNVTARNSYGSLAASNGPLTFTTAAPLIDTTPPAVTASLSPASPTPTNVVTYSASASDASGIAELRLFVDGVNVSTVFNQTGISYSAGPYSLGSSHSYYAVAIDNSSNRNAAQSPLGNFTVVSAPATAASLREVCFVRGTGTAFAVGAGGTIIRSDNFGESWTPQSSGTTLTITGVSFLNSSQGIICYGSLYGTCRIGRTINGGGNWSEVATGTFLINKVAFPAANVAIGVGKDLSNNGGFILRSTDGGANWTLVFRTPPSPTNGLGQPLYAVDFVNTNVGTAVGWGGIIYRTVDGGMNWTPQASGAPGAILLAVDFLDANTGIITDDTGNAYQTVNGGGSWSRQSITSATTNLTSVRFASGSTIVSVGTGWKILRSYNGNWTESGAGININAVDFTDASRGIIVGSEGAILRTDNGGASWTQTSP